MRLTSGGERTVEEMRSNHALPETATAIALDFSIQGEFYRAWFSPKQLIPKKRGEGFTEQSVQSALFALDFIGQTSEAEKLTRNNESFNCMPCSKLIEH